MHSCCSSKVLDSTIMQVDGNSICTGLEYSRRYFFFFFYKFNCTHIKSTSLSLLPIYFQRRELLPTQFLKFRSLWFFFVSNSKQQYYVIVIYRIPQSYFIVNVLSNKWQQIITYICFVIHQIGCFSFLFYSCVIYWTLLVWAISQLL